MPSKKKRLFTKKNSTKYLVLPGNENAVNADGETLPNIFMPVSRRYKPGTSLLIPNFEALCRQSYESTQNKALNLEEITQDFDDASVSDDAEEKSLFRRKKGISFSTEKCQASTINKPHFSEFLPYEDLNHSDASSNQFSDAEEDDLFRDCARTSTKDSCPENIKIFNERFEKIFEEYHDDQIGSLECEEICGPLSAQSDTMKNFLHSSFVKKEEIISLDGCDSSIKEHILNYSNNDEDEIFVKITIDKPIEYDCESILSTYSNLYNHPTVIKEESKIRKINIPDNPLRKKLTKSKLKQLDSEQTNEDSESEYSDDGYSIATTCNIRSRTETPEQKKERKILFKEAKRESRILKKENKVAFKNEKKLQSSQFINAHWNKGVKLV